MSGLQINVRNAQSEALRYLYAQIDAGSMKFNRIEATVIPNSNYIIKGNDYSAQIFLAARDTTAPPKILITDHAQPYDSTIDSETGEVYYFRNPSATYDSIVPESGKGIFRRPGSATGSNRWGGIIEIRGPSGGTIARPFKQSYTVAEGSVVVSPTKMNVFYLGVDNPVDVSVAGIQPDKISIQITNATHIRSRNGYIVKPKRPGNSLVNVYADVDGNKRLMGRKEFRVKIVPDPVAKVAKLRGGAINKNVLLAQLGVVAEMENFDFDLTFRVTEFKVSTVIGGFLQEKTSRSNRFTSEQKALIERINRGQVVYIDDIKAVGPDGSTRNLGTIRFKLN
jgi:gliding motility-associated protein GldM